MNLRYTTPLGITSQFCFCALPIRLDTYRGCGFMCTYCFARFRGGNLPSDQVLPANADSIAEQFRRALERPGRRVSVVGQFLRRGVPIHFGGMSDPLQPAELRYRVTEKVLRLLSEYSYPTVLSTRSLLVVEEPYASILAELKPLVVQFSFSSTSDATARTVEPRCNPPSALLRAMERLSRRGVNVTCRWQPYIPGVSEAPSEFVQRVSGTGCRHVALEHLKVPLERGNPLWAQFVSGTGRDLHLVYRRAGALRDGREYVLPAAAKIERLLEVRDLVRAAGMTFGAADNEFQYLSDTEACCSGVDQFLGFQNFFRHQIGYAVRKSAGAEITYDLIKDEWHPRGSIDWYLNSKSRLGTEDRCEASLKRHVLARWNSDRGPGSPRTFHGITLRERGQRNRPAKYIWSTRIS